MVEAKRPETRTSPMAGLLPADTAGSVNLFANPFAGMAAASAVGVGFASQAFGFWLGTMSGLTEASQRMFFPQAGKDAGGSESSFGMDQSASTRAKTAAKVLIEQTQSTAMEIAAEVSAPPSTRPVSDNGAALQPEDFRKPRAIAKPRKADDLKAISGIGPKLEKVLNQLGVWTYAQIAAWTPEEIAWVDDYLSFEGRIERDGWIGQAREFSGKKR